MISLSQMDMGCRKLLTAHRRMHPKPLLHGMPSQSFLSVEKRGQVDWHAASECFSALSVMLQVGSEERTLLTLEAKVDHSGSLPLPLHVSF